MVLPSVVSKKSIPIKRVLHTTRRPHVIAVLTVLFIITTLTNVIYNIKVAHDLEDLKPIVVKVNTRSIEVEEATEDIQDTIDESRNSESTKEWFEKEKPLITEFPVLSRRNDIIAVLEKLKWKTAIEVGVQKGLLAKRMLDNWPSNTEYKLVDLWGREDGYKEPGDHSNSFHENALRETKRRVKPYMDKVELFIMRSTDAAKKMEDNHFDFVYLDARHDYCAVADDIDSYWPKVRPGGILAGHDFIDAQYAVS